MGVNRIDFVRFLPQSHEYPRTLTFMKLYFSSKIQVGSLIKAISLALVFVLSASWSYAQSSRGSLKVTITDARSAEPLAGATIQLLNTSYGAAASLEGLATIQNIPVGIYVVQVQSLGYESYSVTDVVIRSQRQTELTVTLTPSVVVGQEVVVTGGYFQQDLSQPVSATTFNPEEMRRNPGSGQELARVLSVIPGVVARGEVSQDLMVRGGSPGENGFYIDNIPMPGVAHFQQPGGSSNGPIGIVNTDLISDVTFFTGGFSAAYGDRNSAIGEVSYRNGTRERFAGDASLSLGGMGVTLEGPLAGSTASYLVSARRSYLDLIANAINTGGAPSYSDAQIKLIIDVNARNQLTFLNIYGTSQFTANAADAEEAGISTTTDANYEQNTIGLNHRYLWKSRGFTNTSISWSWKTDDTESYYWETDAYDALFSIRNSFAALRSFSRYNASDRLQLEFGADARIESGVYDYRVAAGTTNGGGQRPELIRDLEIDGITASGFASAIFTPVPKLTFTTGLRADFNDYNSDLTLDPRISASYRLAPRWTLNAAWGYYSQLNDRFLMSQYEPNRDLKSVRSRHLMAGIDYLLTSDTKLTLEVYDKAYTNVPELPAGTQGYAPFYVPDNAFLLYETPLQSSGEAWARGIELFLQKKLAQDFYGMVSVAYYRSRYTGFDGREYNRNFDTKFQTSVIGGWRPNDKVEVSARWSYIGGRPFTPIDEIQSSQTASTVYNLNRINESSMPAYHALYLRADRRFFFNRTSIVTFIETWNTYGRKNIDGYFWNAVDGEVTSIEQFSFIPVGGVKFEF